MILLLVKPNYYCVNQILSVLLLNPAQYAKKIVTEPDRVLNWIWVMQFKFFKQITPVIGK